MAGEINITLIHPPKPKSLKLKSRQWVRPLGLHYMAAMLEKHGFGVTVLDFEKDLVDESQRIKILEDNRADLFGITSVTYTRFQAINIARDLKKIFPKSVVMVGGVHFQFVAEETLSHINEIDIVCLGEGEYVILNVAKALAFGKSVEELDDIQGIVFRRDGRTFSTGPAEVIRNLDEIPFYTRFTWEDYPEYVKSGDAKLPAATVITSRGCPYQCAFCSMGCSAFRVRSPGNVVDEIEYFKERFKLEAVHFFDSTFAASPEHCRAVVNEMINRRINMRWSCGLRADTPPDLLPLMREAGLVSFSLGIETGSPKILKSISKGISLEQVEQLIERAEQLDVEVSPFFMLSHPDENFEDALETVRFRDKLRRYKNIGTESFTVTMIFPGTRVERLAREKGILPHDFLWSLPYESKLSKKFAMGETVPIYVEKLSPDEIEEIIKIDRFNSFHRGRSIYELVKKGIYSIFVNKDFSYLFDYLKLIPVYLFSRIHRRYR